MSIEYSTHRPLSDDEFVDLLQRSTLAERRPVGDRERIHAMLANADVLCTAWDDGKLVGVARSVTDFAYCCYLSDLAVDLDYQKQGIGRELVRQVQSLLDPAAKLILLAAPAAVDYYRRIGFDPHDSAWVIPAGRPLA